MRRSLARLATDTLRGRAVEFDRDALARSCVVLAPHPDDEVLACGGTIIEKKRAGAEVHVVFVTDGCRSHPIDPAELRALRHAEALAAANVLGLAADDLAFLDFEDGDLPGHVTPASERLRVLLEKWRPAQVFAPCSFDWHPDHVATHDIAVRAIAQTLGTKIELYEYAVYLWRAWPWSLANVGERSGTYASSIAMAAKFARGVTHKVTTRDVERKRAALGAHRTQMEKREPGWWTLGDWGADFVTWSTTGVELFCRR